MRCTSPIGDSKTRLDACKGEAATVVWMESARLQAGRVVGLLQCKWVYRGENIFVDRKASHAGTRQILAALFHSEDVSPKEGIEFWPRERVAALCSEIRGQAAARAGPTSQNAMKSHDIIRSA
jgi:hypothetical protein